MLTATKIPQCNPPRTHVHLVQQLRNPVTAILYEAWNGGKNQMNKGVIGHYPKPPKWRKQLPKYVHKEDEGNGLTVQGGLVSIQTVCELLLCFSWFLFLF
jgi:hypothetical protein